MYSWISPPPSERSPAMRFPEKPRLRTTRPKVWPFVSTIRWPAMNGVVATIMDSASFVLVAGAGRASDRMVVAARPPRRAVRARAAVAQQGVRVEAGRVPVAPVRRNGVVADEVDVGHPCLLVRQRRA